jgi:thiamine-phosphate pyrophosphorylase
MTLAEATQRLKPAGVPRAILVTDSVRLPDPCQAVSALPRGGAVLLRHYDSPDRVALAARLARWCRASGRRLLVAEDWRLAAAVGAAGLHLPEGLARTACLAPALGWVRRRHLILTVAAHSPAALARARRLGAAAAILSPAFATASHPEATAIGAVRWARWAERAGLPVIALGGMTERTARALRRARIAGIAAIGGWRT